MRFITDKIEWTDSMKAFTTEQLTKKLFKTDLDIEDAEVKICKLNDTLFKVCIDISIFRAQDIADDFYIAVVKAASKLKNIVSKENKRVIRHNTASKQPETTTDVEFIAKEKTLILQSQTAEQAIADFRNTDYEFYVYKDVDCSDCITVIYKRFDDTLGLIHCK